MEAEHLIEAILYTIIAQWESHPGTNFTVKSSFSYKLQRFAGEKAPPELTWEKSRLLEKRTREKKGVPILTRVGPDAKGVLPSPLSLPACRRHDPRFDLLAKKRGGRSTSDKPEITQGFSCLAESFLCQSPSRKHGRSSSPIPKAASNAPVRQTPKSEFMQVLQSNIAIVLQPDQGHTREMGPLKHTTDTGHDWALGGLPTHLGRSQIQINLEPWLFHFSHTCHPKLVWENVSVSLTDTMCQ